MLEKFVERFSMGLLVFGSIFLAAHVIVAVVRAL